MSRSLKQQNKKPNQTEIFTSGSKCSEKSAESSRLSLAGHLQSGALVWREHLVHNQLTQAYLLTDVWNKPQLFFLQLFFPTCVTVSGFCTLPLPQLLAEHREHFLLPMTASLADWDFTDPPALLALQKYSPAWSLFRFFRIRLFLYLYKEGSSSEPLWYLEAVKETELHCLARAEPRPNAASGFCQTSRLSFSIYSPARWHHPKIIPLPQQYWEVAAGQLADRRSCQSCLLRFFKLLFVCFSSKSLGRWNYCTCEKHQLCTSQGIHHVQQLVLGVFSCFIAKKNPPTLWRW